MPAHLIVALFLFAIVSPAKGSTGSWEKIDDRDGIEIYKKEVPGSRVFAFRGSAVVKAPLLKVASVVVDAKRAIEWVDALGENRIVRMLSKDEAILYTHVKTPFVLKDRDFLCRVRLDYDPKEKVFSLVYFPYVDPAVPETRYIRGEVMDSSFKLASINGGTETLVTAEMHTDPKGSVPKWIVNLFQKNWPHKTLKSLRAQVAKPDITENADLKAAIESAK